MKKTGIKYILESMHGAKLISDTGSKEITSVAIDSRQVKSGTLFFAVIGERNDGHDSYQQLRKADVLQWWYPIPIGLKRFQKPVI